MPRSLGAGGRDAPGDPTAKTSERTPMRLSARNQLQGNVIKVNKGRAIANVEIDVAGQRLVASVTVEAVEELSLSEGTPVTAVIKASDVIVATD